jgi:hypothetical protein
LTWAFAKVDNISMARRDSVAHMDRFIGPKR